MCENSTSQYIIINISVIIKITNKMIILKTMKIITAKLNYFYISSFRYTVWILFVNKFHKCEKTNKDSR